MGVNSSKGRVEIDVKRQAWVRIRPNAAHSTKQHGRTRAQSAPGVRPQINRRQQHYDVPPNYDPQEPERPIRGRGGEDRNRPDDRGVSRAQSSRSQGRFAKEVFDDEAGVVPIRGHLDESPAYHNGRGLGRGQHDDRGISRVQRNPDHGHVDNEAGVPLRGHLDEGPVHHTGRGLSRGQDNDRRISRVHFDEEAGGVPIRGQRDDGPGYRYVRGLSREQYDNRGITRVQRNPDHGRSQDRSRQPHVEDVLDDRAGRVPNRGNRDEGPVHHNSRGLGRGQYDDREISRVQRNPDLGGRGQQGYDFTPRANGMRDEHAAVGSQRVSYHDRQLGSQHGSQHGSHRGRQQNNQGR